MIAEGIKQKALYARNLTTREAWQTVEAGVVTSFVGSQELYTFMHNTNDADRRTFWLIVAEVLGFDLERDRLQSARAHAAREASQWAMEARTHRSTVLDILRYFGLPENDWEALRLIQSRDAPHPALAPFAHMGRLGQGSASLSSCGCWTSDISGVHREGKCAAHASGVPSVSPDAQPQGNGGTPPLVEQITRENRHPEQWPDAAADGVSAASAAPNTPVTRNGEA